MLCYLKEEPFQNDILTIIKRCEKKYSEKKGEISDL
jgi:hypothetical protein